VVITVLAVLLLAASALAVYGFTRTPASDAPPGASYWPTSPAGEGDPNSQSAAAPSAPPTTSPAEPAASPDTVQVSSDVTSQYANDVQALFQRYFDSINNKDYAGYAATMLHPMSQETFSTGYLTTHDSMAAITGIQPSGADSVMASVSFTSTQDPSNAPAQLRVPRICWGVQWAVTNLSSGSGGQIDVSNHGPTSMQAC
jgi:hypothetical protein